ncbi:MAG: cytidine deaminase [Prevotellaceae bacterium]|nr:cytidine deaminase [Prevotella sp.]MDD7258232.1 cytidine deaminase [Prevotellaceae bacterium]MDY6130586.1 cytidine deaminase [Prevotella sp.]
MKDIKIESNVKLYRMDELEDSEQRLVKKAMEATNNSYSPYSRFRVGAALRLENGTEVIGANQENAAFPVTLCAERTAVFAAQAQYPDQPVLALAIAAQNESGFVNDPVSPCGSCRQVVLEIEQRYGRSVKIYLHGKRGVYVIDGIRNLLPLSFIDSSMR